MRVPRKFCQRVPNLIRFYLADEVRMDPNTTISGPSTARQ